MKEYVTKQVKKYYELPDENLPDMKQILDEKKSYSSTKKKRY